MRIILIKSIAFTLLTVLATAALAATIRNSSGPGETYSAVYTDATSLNKGDDVRMAGVKVGTVTNVPLYGWYSAVAKLPAANASASLPEPATSSTFPLCSTTACMARAGAVNGITCHVPFVQASPELHAWPGVGWVTSTIR